MRRVIKRTAKKSTINIYLLLQTYLACWVEKYSRRLLFFSHENKYLESGYRFLDNASDSCVFFSPNNDERGDEGRSFVAWNLYRHSYLDYPCVLERAYKDRSQDAHYANTGLNTGRTNIRVLPKVEGYTPLTPCWFTSWSFPMFIPCRCQIPLPLAWDI